MSPASSKHTVNVTAIEHDNCGCFVFFTISPDDSVSLRWLRPILWVAAVRYEPKMPVRFMDEETHKTCFLL